MEMKVEHRLTGLFPAVGNYAETFKAKFFCKLCNNCKDMTNNSAVLLGYCTCRNDMFLRYNKEMSRSLRVNVIEGITQFVFVDLI